MAEGAPECRAGWTGWGRYRVLFYLLAALVVLDLVVAGQRRLWHTYDPDEYRERLLACRRRPHDLVVVGGSTVGEGIDPTVLSGVSWHGQRLDDVFSLGLPGATTSEVWVAVRNGLPASPRLLVYGITASDLNDNRNEPHGPRSLMTAADLADWFRHHRSRATWAVRNYLRERLGRLWSLSYYRNGIRLWAADQAEHLWPGLFPEAATEARTALSFTAAVRQDHGFAPRPDAQVRRLDQLKAAGSYGPPFHFLDNYRLGEYLSCLHCLLDWCEQRGVAVVLLDMPVSADLEERFHPAEFARYREMLAELQRRRGVRILSAGRATLGLTDADFADLIHLNASGTARLSGWLRRQLADERPPES
jgi:hypothetical protein